MNDFLTRLAQRSLGAAPLIAPRLPSLFAPFEESQTSNVADTTAATDAARNSTLASLPLQSRTKGNADPASGETRTNVYPPQRPTAPKAVIAPAPAARIDSTQPRVDSTLIPLVYPPQRPTAPKAVIAPAPAARIDSTQPRVDSTLIPLVESAQAHAQATPPLVTPVAPRSAASLEPSTAPHKQDTPAAAPEQWLPLLPQRTAEFAAPFSALADTTVGADTGTPPAPTVHITIGRVEVRANIVTPPAAPRPRTASKPTLSLGDYLKRGAGAS